MKRIIHIFCVILYINNSNSRIFHYIKTSPAVEHKAQFETIQCADVNHSPSQCYTDSSFQTITVRMPCVYDSLVFPQRLHHPLILKGLHMWKEIIFPRTGFVYLASDFQYIKPSSIFDANFVRSNYRCQSSGLEVPAPTAIEETSFFDLNSWSIENSNKLALLNFEMLPSSDDDIIFHEDATYNVRIDTNVQVNSWRSHGFNHTTETLSEMLSSIEGQMQFRPGLERNFSTVVNVSIADHDSVRYPLHIPLELNSPIVLIGYNQLTRLSHWNGIKQFACRSVNKIKDTRCYDALTVFGNCQPICGLQLLFAINLVAMINANDEREKLLRELDITLRRYLEELENLYQISTSLLLLDMIDVGSDNKIDLHYQIFINQGNQSIIDVYYLENVVLDEIMNGAILSNTLTTHTRDFLNLYRRLVPSLGLNIIDFSLEYAISKSLDTATLESDAAATFIGLILLCVCTICIIILLFLSRRYGWVKILRPRLDGVRFDRDEDQVMLIASDDGRQTLNDYRQSNKFGTTHQLTNSRCESGVENPVFDLESLCSMPIDNNEGDLLEMKSIDGS